jgi:hypothetical protein
VVAVEQIWPGRGPWAITGTSGDVDWHLAAAALAATAEVPVAAVVLGAAVAGDDPMRPFLAGLVELREAGTLNLAHVRELVRILSLAHGLVLVAAPAGLLAPLGDDGWTLADLAAAVAAPAVVVTGAGPDAANHTSLALGALAGHGIAAAVVTIGEVDEDALPVTPAGRLPAQRPDDFSGAAAWLDPILRVRAGQGPVTGPAALPGRRPVSGTRLVLALIVVFLLMVAAVCTLAWANRGPGQGGAPEVRFTSQFISLDH